jgi:uncharacterized membrane protein YhhN
MFPSLTQPFQIVWLIGLLIAWAVLLFGGFIIGSDDPQRRMPLWTRLGSSAVLDLAAWSWFAFSRGTSVQSYALLIAMGMTLGFLGDLFMAGVLPRGRSVMGGLSSFALGHIVYITAFLQFSAQEGLTDGGRRWPALMVWLLVGATGWTFIVFRSRSQHNTLRWAALPYSLLLASTAGLTTGMAIQDPRFLPLALGGALFLLSDLILAGELFGKFDFPLIRDIIWLTYGPAQALIVYSIGAALSVARVP